MVKDIVPNKICSLLTILIVNINEDTDLAASNGEKGLRIIGFAVDEVTIYQLRTI